MKKTSIIIAIAMSMCTAAMAADTLRVETFRYAGPFEVRQPVQLDSTDVNAKKYEASKLLDTKVNLETITKGQLWGGEELPASTAQVPALHLLGCSFNVPAYFKGSLCLQKSPKDYVIYWDGEESSAGDVTLRPGTHTLVLKYLSKPDQKDSLQMSLCSDSAAQVSASAIKAGDPVVQKQLFTIEQMLSAKRYASLDISADGKWIIACEGITREDWGDYDYYLWERATGKKIKLTQNSHWMPTSSKFYQIRHVDDKSLLVVIDPATLAEEVWVKDLPCDYFEMLPTEDRLLMTMRQDGPSELNPEAFQFVHPDDRQPGWRDRSYLALFDIQSGMMQQLTFGYNNQWAADMTADGKRILITKGESRLTARPTTLYSIYQLDLETLQLDTLVNRDGFVSGAKYSPDGKQVLISGTPECLDGIGNVVPEGMTPSMVDMQLYLMNISDRKVTPLTKAFDPMVSAFEWSKADGMIYFNAENCDSCSLYRLNPANGKIDMLAQPEEVVGRFALANHAPVLAFAGESNNHSWRLYNMELGKKSKGAKCMQDLNAEVYDPIELSEAQAWVCKNSIGDDVHCRYYLPNDFDASAQYPMIVYYYGGCSGTLRNLEYTYPWTIWAAQGYVVLVVNPSGATGFGQEWAARHVNTAGVDPARDIIEATTTFCDQHPFVNRAKLGCIGASYGGFMTQYLQTVTDIFRCAVSHAGISDHTTYWGFGYWGYTYSEVSMANTYPWTRKDLYVDRSPLYNVDKIKSSMLFLHGTEDTNVPYNNSVQMYTALKLLGQDVAMVSIKGEDHGIRKPSRRRLWHNVTMAWFARCLKDDPTWWNALYPERTL